MICPMAPEASPEFEPSGVTETIGTYSYSQRNCFGRIEEGIYLFAIAMPGERRVRKEPLGEADVLEFGGRLGSEGVSVAVFGLRRAGGRGSRRLRAPAESRPSSSARVMIIVAASAEGVDHRR